MFDRKVSAIRQGPLKLIQHPDQSFAFDLSTDLSEQSDLASTQTKEVERLEATLDQWSEELADPAFADLRSWP